MIPSFKPGIMSSNIIRTAASGPVLTVNWTTPGSCTSFSYQTSSTETITGISTSQNIYWACVDCSQVNTSTAILYSKNGGAYVGLSPNTNISVSNNDTLTWRFYTGSSLDFGGAVLQISVKNASDNNSIVDNLMQFSYCGV